MEKKESICFNGNSYADWNQIANITKSPVFSVTILNTDEKEIGTVHLCVEETPIMRKRFYSFVDCIDEIMITTINEYKPLELLEDRLARLKHYDEAVIHGFQELFPLDDIRQLFIERNPTDSVNGRTYCLRLIDSILMGLESAITEYLDDGSSKQPRLYSAFVKVSIK